MSSIGIYATDFINKYYTRAKNFECFNCKLVSPKNYFIECQHCICKKCLKKSRFCFYCHNQSIIIDGENPTAFQFILTEIILNSFLTRCVFAPCGWEGTFNDFIKLHYKECRYKKGKKLLPEYFEEFSIESHEKNIKSKSEIKIVRKNVKNKYLLNNNLNDNSINEKDIGFNRSNRKDNIDYYDKYMGNKIYENKGRKNEIRSSNDDFQISHNNFISIKNGLFFKSLYPPHRINNPLFQNDDTFNKEKSFIIGRKNNDNKNRKNNLDEIVIDLDDDSCENEEESEKEGKEEEEEEQEKDKYEERIYNPNGLNIEIEDDEEEDENEEEEEEERENEESVVTIEDEEDADEEDNVEEEEENNEFIENDTTKATKGSIEKGYEIEEIEEEDDEDNYKDEDYEQEEYEESEEEENQRKARKKSQKRRNKNEFFNYNYLNKKRKHYIDYFDESDEEDDNNYNGFYGYKYNTYYNDNKFRNNKFKRKKF